jgi:hypothetical protein
MTMALYRYKFTEQQNFKEETGKSMLKGCVLIAQAKTL